MKILMLTTKFCHPDGSPWLSSELATELIRLGHEVTVLNLEWSGKDINTKKISEEIPQLNLYNYKAIRTSITAISILLRWALSSIKLLPFLLKQALSGNRFDLMIGFSPCSALHSALPFAKLISRDACLIYWDFFPVHNQEISGKVPKMALPAVKFLEKTLVRLYNRVGCMSNANIVFFDNYFERPSKPRTFLLPIWTSLLTGPSAASGFSKKRYFENDDAVIFVFGGQLVEGRGIIEICEAVVSANKINRNISLIVCGDGILSKKVIDFEKSHPSIIRYLGNLSRNDYLSVLASSTVGVVSTVAGVSAPSFPSKSLDYMACSLPILAAVEPATDFGKIVEENAMGVSCTAGDIESITKAMIQICVDCDRIKKMGQNGNHYLKENNSIQNAASLILEK